MSRPSKPWFNVARNAWVVKIAGRQVVLARAASKNDQRAKKAAEQEYHRLKANPAATPAPPGDIQLVALLDQFLDSIEGRAAALTEEFYDRHLRSFGRFIGRGRMAMSIDQEDIDRWLARGYKKRLPTQPGDARPRFEQRPYSQSTRRGAIVAVKRAFRWAAKKKPPLIAENPLADVKAPKMATRDAVLDEPTIRRIIGASTGPFRDLIAFMWETGCRPSEAANLEARHVNFDQGVIQMPSKTTAATGKDRTIYLTAAAMAILRRNADRNPDGCVFRNRNGSPWHRFAVAKRFARLRAKLGLGADGTAEAIRHAFGTDGALRLPPLVLKELMGHASTAMVDRYYVHLDRKRDEMRRAATEVRNGLESTEGLPIGPPGVAGGGGGAGDGSGGDDEPRLDVGA